jgi:hypothetical protein
LRGDFTGRQADTYVRLGIAGLRGFVARSGLVDFFI